ncbi:MAG TPA: MFS transporter [Candidatus Nanoarchaeia archaeon]|nr:MFS transporter [Candidatus Nanoarchaeia archaeon]
MFRIKERLPKGCSFTLFVVTFFYSLAITFLSPIFPLFIKHLVGNEAYVGFVISFQGVLWILSTLVVGKLICLTGKTRMLRISLFGLGLSFFALVFVKNIYSLLVLEVFKTFFSTAAVFAISLMIRDHVSKKNIGSTEGAYFSVTNSAWLFGPLLGGLIAQAYGFNPIFLIGGLFCFSSLMIFLYDEPKYNIIKQETDNGFYSNIKDYFKQRDLIIVYLMSISLAFWWVFVYAYVPLYLADLGEKIIGYILAALVLPLILLELPIGRLADKGSYKWLFFIGFFLLGSIAIFLSFVDNFLIFAILIISASVGAAIIEPLREAHLFKIIKSKDTRRFLVVFRTGYELGYLISPIIFSLVLIKNNTNYSDLFLIIGILMLIFALISLFIKEHKKIKGEVKIPVIKK